MLLISYMNVYIYCAIFVLLLLILFVQWRKNGILFTLFNSQSDNYTSKQSQLEESMAQWQILRDENEELKVELASEFAKYKAEKQAFSDVNKSLNTQLIDSFENVTELRDKNECLKINIAKVLAEHHSEKKSWQEKIQILLDAKESLTKEFKLLASQVLESRQQSMTEQTKLLVTGLMEPMTQSFKSFKDRMENVHKENIEGRASLVEQLSQLQKLNIQMTDEAKNLTNALKSDSKIQGNWGELILEKLLQASGLREGIEYDREKNFSTDNSRFRPDVILNLPDNKHIVIDSKVSLTAYELTVNNIDNPKHLKNHLKSLTRHVDSLAKKRYDHLDDLNSPDFVLMFIPIEGAYLLAIDEDHTVFEKAFDKRVAVVTPTTLFTTLKVIEHLWRYERQSEYTAQLIKRATEVHDKFVGFVESFEKIGKQLQTAQSTYDSAWKQLTTGNGNLIRQAEMLKTLAGKTKKDIPAHLLEVAEGEIIINEKK